MEIYFPMGKNDVNHLHLLLYLGAGQLTWRMFPEERDGPTPFL
jgi:hypothetical protein